MCAFVKTNKKESKNPTSHRGAGNSEMHDSRTEVPCVQMRIPPPQEALEEHCSTSSQLCFVQNVLIQTVL